MTSTEIAVRCLFAYALLHLLVRLSGKRTILHGTALDLMVAIMAGGLVSHMIWSHVGATHLVTALGTLFVLHMLGSIFGFVDFRVSQLLCKKERPMVEHGDLRWDQMAIARISYGKLMRFLRAKDVTDSREIHKAELECSGALSILRQRWARPCQKSDQKFL